MIDAAEHKEQLFALMRRMVQLGAMLPKDVIDIDASDPDVVMIVNEMLKTRDAVDALIGRKRAPGS